LDAQARVIRHKGDVDFLTIAGLAV
jgi:hypothetical protein